MALLISDSIDAFAWLNASSSFIKLLFSDSTSRISFLTTASSSPNFLASELCAFNVRSFESLSAWMVFILIAASIAFNLSISRSMKSCRSFRFLSSSRLSICFFTSPILAIAISKRWSAACSCFSDSAFFSSKYDNPIKSSMVCLFSSGLNSEILVTVPCWTTFSWCRPALAISKRSRMWLRFVFFLFR